MNQLLQSAEDFTLNSVILTSERLNRSFNLTNLVAEINIFESIQSLYLTGSIIIVDDQDIFNLLDIQGTERLEITVGIPEDTELVITKNFVIVNADNMVKTNDHSVVHTFYMIEDIGYLNNVQKYSKAYTGTGETIINNILTQTINKQLYNYNSRTETVNGIVPSAQARFRYIVPYVSPFDAIITILQKLTTPQGLPYFAHSTFNREEIILKDLQTILNTPPFNRNRPFIYSQSTANKGADDILFNAYSISDMSIDVNEDTLLLSQLGGLGSTIQTIDVTTGERQTSSFNAYSFFENLTRLNVLPPGQTKLLLDQFFVPDRTKRNVNTLQDYNSRVFRQLSGHIYGKLYNGFHEENFLSDNNLKVYSYLIKEHLLKNLLTISVPGLHFLTNAVDKTVGNQIEILTFKSIVPTESQFEDNFKDSKRSGNYIMLQKRHIFNCVSYKHNVVIQCGRITQEKVE